METRNKGIIELSGITINKASKEIYSPKKEIEIQQCIHLLHKTSRKNLGISWALRTSIFVTLIIVAAELLKGATRKTNPDQNDFNTILALQRNIYQNQTDLLNTYQHTSFVTPVTCMQGLPIITTPTEPNIKTKNTTYRVTGITLPRLNLNITLDRFNCSITIDKLCQKMHWRFLNPIPNIHHRYASFNRTCCPSLYKICGNIVAYPTLPSLAEHEYKDINSIVGGSLALLAIVIEALNTFFTEKQKLLSSPRLFFFPLYKQFSLFSKTDEKIIRAVASQYHIAIIENDLKATIDNFKAGLNNESNSPRVRPAQQ